MISCHADTGFSSHTLRKLGRGVVEGHLDNFSGVYAVMTAYFSGRMDKDYVRIELTYGEEKGLIGASEVAGSLNERDVVLVVDVTATPTEKDFVVEKCSQPALQAFLREALAGMEFDLYADCPDPVSTSDEVDVYSVKCRHTCFIGVPCEGGDYNAGVVRCRERSLDRIAEALCRIAERFPGFCGAQKVALR